MDDEAKREKVAAALRSPGMADRDFVDVIIALGMAKEGFDWVWCEHALTVGYRSSLTEIVQIIGRATRDAPGKESARFTNLIAKPDATDGAVVEAVNDTLKAIAASLLMEQVLAPRFEFRPKRAGGEARDGFDYGEGGYDAKTCNVGMNASTGTCEVEILGLAEPNSAEAKRICREDLTDLVTSYAQDKPTIERGMFDEDVIPQELSQTAMGRIVAEKYPALSAEDAEAVRQRAVAAVALVQEGKRALSGMTAKLGGAVAAANTALIDGVRRFVTDVRELNVDLIDSVNPFEGAKIILGKALNGSTLRQMAAVIGAKKVRLTPEEARGLAKRAVDFKRDRGRLPSAAAPDPWERRDGRGRRVPGPHEGRRGEGGDGGPGGRPWLSGRRRTGSPRTTTPCLRSWASSPSRSRTAPTPPGRNGSSPGSKR